MEVPYTPFRECLGSSEYVQFEGYWLIFIAPHTAYYGKVPSHYQAPRTSRTSPPAVTQ